MPSPPETPAAPPGPVAFGPFVLDAAEARLSRDGSALALNGRALSVLAALAARPGQLLVKDELLDAVWGHRHVSESVLKNAINTLRGALGDDAQAPRYVETVPRRGYRFIAECRALAAPAAAPAPATAAPGNLPQAAGALVGREADAEQLAALLSRHRLVTLSGLGGIGKTRLALQAAALAPPPDGAWLLRLDALDAADGGAALVPTLAQTLRLGPGAAASAEALGRALAPLSLRLVLDNAEHLVEPVAALVNTLLAAAPQLQLLVTSQVPLRVAGEQLLLLAPLALPADLGDAAPDPQGYPAAQLFCERLQQRLPGWVPTPEEHADIAAICRALDGVPLALELAAARAPLLGVAGVRARLDQRFAMLTQGARDAAARHRTLGAALDWTYSLLGEAERHALQMLALFAGSFSAEDAEALLDEGAALDLVEALRERSLVVVEPAPGGPPRLRLFDSVRRHALAHLADSGAEPRARARHLARLLARFERADREEFDTPSERWLPPLRLEVDNLRAALHVGLEREPALREDALRLLGFSASFWYRGGLRPEGVRWFERARTLPASDGTRVLLDHGYGLFVNFTQIGSPPEAIAALQRSRPALLAAGDRRRAYLSYYSERMLVLRVAPQQDPTPLIEGMRAQLQPGWGALERRYLGMVEALAARDEGGFDRYGQRCAALIGPCRAAGGRVEAWSMENGLVQALALQGRLDEACATISRTVADVREMGLQREQLPVLAIAASLHLWRGTDAYALTLAHEALRLLAADGMVWWMADALPWAAWHQGRPADAARLQGWADAKARGRGDSRGPMFGRMRDSFQAALTAHADHARLLAVLQQAAAAEAATMADEVAQRLAFGGRDGTGRTLAA